MLELLGLSSQAQPSSELLLSRVHPQDRVQLVEVIKQALASAQPFVYELRIEPGFGQLRRVVLTHEVLPDSAGRPPLIRGSLADVTERHRLEQQGIAGTIAGLPAAAAMVDAATAIHASALPATLAALPGVQVTARYLPLHGNLGGDVPPAGGRHRPGQRRRRGRRGHGLPAAGAMSRLSAMIRAFGGTTAPGPRWLPPCWPRWTRRLLEDPLNGLRHVRAGYGQTEQAALDALEWACERASSQRGMLWQ